MMTIKPQAIGIYECIFRFSEIPFPSRDVQSPPPHSLRTWSCLFELFYSKFKTCEDMSVIFRIYCSFFGCLIVRWLEYRLWKSRHWHRWVHAAVLVQRRVAWSGRISGAGDGFFVLGKPVVIHTVIIVRIDLNGSRWMINVIDDGSWFWRSRVGNAGSLKIFSFK